jgi:hypothetical protein
LIRPLVEGPLDRPLILTFPTKILMQAQAALLKRTFPGASHWPDNPRPTPDLTIFEYSTDSLVRYLRANSGMADVDRSGLLEAILTRHGLQCRKNLFVTTPDVLYLMQQGCYRGSRWLTSRIQRPIVFFDEFHLYTNLRHFAPLVEWLVEILGATVVFLSATPTTNPDLEKVRQKFSVIDIPFADSLGAAGDFCFNHPLDLRIVSCAYTKPDQLLATLREVLPSLPKPCAIIFDSVFRLRHLERRLRQAFPDLQFHEYSGMRHDRLAFSDTTVILGTSSIEVGVEMPIKSLITEAAFWTSAIQRLGRVGRQGPGVAVLLTRRNLEPFLNDTSTFPRSRFETEILQEALSERMGGTALVAGEMFRGDSRPFLVVDQITKEPFPYTESVFSMFEIDRTSFCSAWRRLAAPDKRRCLEGDFGVSSTLVEDILLRDRLVPFWGIVTGQLRQTYEPVFAAETDGGLEIRVGEAGRGETFFFDAEDSA